MDDEDKRKVPKGSWSTIIKGSKELKSQKTKKTTQTTNKEKQNSD